MQFICFAFLRLLLLSWGHRMFDAIISFLTAPLQNSYDALMGIWQFIVDFFDKDIYPLITKTVAEWIKASLIQTIEFKIWALGFSWDVAKDLLISLNISPLIASAWSSLDSKLLQFLTFFRIPDGINLLLTAWATRFVYRFIGFK
jgi:hypothetical protein